MKKLSILKIMFLVMGFVSGAIAIHSFFFLKDALLLAEFAGAMAAINFILAKKAP